MSIPYFPMFPDDFEADTAHLSLAEDGAYNRLLRLQWRSPKCVLPDDDAWIYRKVRATSDGDKQTVAAMLSEFFVREDGHVFSPRLRREFTKATDTFSRRSEAGSKGGKGRALKTKDFVPSRAKAGLKQPEPEPEPKRREAKASLSPIDDIAVAVSAYNARAAESGWPEVKLLSKSRRSALKARLGECGGLDGWVAALSRAAASSHCCGQNDRGWVANFDFLTRQSSFTKLMEGNYDNRTGTQGGTASANAPADRYVDAARMRRSQEGDGF